MEKNKHAKRNKKHYYKRQNAGNRILDRLTYNPARHKQRKIKEMRQKCIFCWTCNEAIKINPWL